MFILPSSWMKPVLFCFERDNVVEIIGSNPFTPRLYWSSRLRQPSCGKLSRCISPFCFVLALFSHPNLMDILCSICYFEKNKLLLKLEDGWRPSYLYCIDRLLPLFAPPPGITGIVCLTFFAPSKRFLAKVVNNLGDFWRPHGPTFIHRWEFFSEAISFYQLSVFLGI